MHDQLGKTEFWQWHMEALLRDGGRRVPRNERFRFGRREDSPVRRFARRKFQESVRSMVAGAYVPSRDDPGEA